MIEERELDPPQREPQGATRVATVVLGVAMLTFGLLKLVSPFRDWYATQISASGLPASSYPFGIASEILNGALFLGAWFLPTRARDLRRMVWRVASIWLIAIMLVAVYVHLQPAVPAAVLPLKIKPPVIPLTMLLMAGWTWFSLRRLGRVVTRHHK